MSRLRVVFAGLCLVILWQVPFASDEQWRKALPPYDFDFPHDHSSHPEFKIEWWYYTGNLAAKDGRKFGYQLTFFRVGVVAKPQNPSRWAIRDLYVAHLAVSDIDGARFINAEKLNRAGIGWAGADPSSYRVWNEDWEARLGESGDHLLRASSGKIGIELDLKPGKPPVAHGAYGVSRKGSIPGNSSHYYSLTRMPTSGTLLVDGESIEVRGSSWMDHEFGTSFLEKGQIGWDWLSIQLDDGTDLMVYQFRRDDKAPDRHSNATIVYAGGASAPIGFDQFKLIPGETWTSPASRASYPINWKVEIPARGISLEVRAALNDQEMRTTESTGVTYWEGSIDVTGTHLGRRVGGRGYLEMTGYTGAGLGVLIE